MPEAFFGLAQFIVEMGDALATPVLQFHPFQIVPEPLSSFGFVFYISSRSHGGRYHS
jgi:hypothetical protein